MVTTVCYGEKKEWKSREEAMSFFLEGMTTCDGSEQERYTSIYIQLVGGSTYCTDEDFQEEIMYITYEEPFTGRSFSEHQMQNIYCLMIDKKEYPTYKGWIYDMLRSGVYEKL